MAISAGVTFFAIRKPIKTLLVVILMLMGPAYIAFDYFNSYRATIQEAEPIAVTKPTSFRVAFDEYQDSEIIINGKLYGYADKRFEAWVLKDIPAILVHDKMTGDVSKVEIRGLKKK